MSNQNWIKFESRLVKYVGSNAAEKGYLATRVQHNGICNIQMISTFVLPALYLAFNFNILILSIFCVFVCNFVLFCFVLILFVCNYNKRWLLETRQQHTEICTIYMTNISVFRDQHIFCTTCILRKNVSFPFHGFQKRVLSYADTHLRDCPCRPTNRSYDAENNE